MSQEEKEIQELASALEAAQKGHERKEKLKALSEQIKPLKAEIEGLQLEIEALTDDKEQLSSKYNGKYRVIGDSYSPHGYDLMSSLAFVEMIRKTPSVLLGHNRLFSVFWFPSKQKSFAFSEFSGGAVIDGFVKSSAFCADHKLQIFGEPSERHKTKLDIFLKSAEVERAISDANAHRAEKLKIESEIKEKKSSIKELEVEISSIWSEESLEEWEEREEREEHETDHLEPFTLRKWEL